MKLPRPPLYDKINLFSMLIQMQWKYLWYLSILTKNVIFPKNTILCQNMARHIWRFGYALWFFSYFLISRNKKFLNSDWIIFTLRQTAKTCQKYFLRMKLTCDFQLYSCIVLTVLVKFHWIFFICQMKINLKLPIFRHIESMFFFLLLFLFLFLF